MYVSDVYSRMPEETLFKNESKQHRADVAAYLRSVADKLEGDGELTLTAGTQSLDISVPARLEFEVKAERETSGTADTGEVSLELELEWSEGDEPDGELSID
jgi:amphi-Trp domain-containing protein